jgi:hypothetical protein
VHALVAEKVKSSQSAWRALQEKSYERSACNGALGRALMCIDQSLKKLSLHNRRGKPSTKKSYITVKSFDKDSALHWAASSGHDEAVRLLVKKGADVAAKNKGGLTPLHLAAERGHDAVARLLLVYSRIVGEHRSQSTNNLFKRRSCPSIGMVVVETGDGLCDRRSDLHQLSEDGRKQTRRILIRLRFVVAVYVSKPDSIALSCSRKMIDRDCRHYCLAGSGDAKTE